MNTLLEVERLALALPEDQRIVPVNHLLNSLLPGLDDEGIAEALRRDAELDADPSIGISLEEFDAFILQRRPAAWSPDQLGSDTLTRRIERGARAGVGQG